MPDVGSGVMEIRVRGEREFRVFYVARFNEAVYVLPCFVMKTRTTRKADLESDGSAIRRCSNRGEPKKGRVNAMKSTSISQGSGDVYQDLGFSASEARNLHLRAELMTALRNYIEKEGLTQADAAKRLNVRQPRVPDLTRGKISRFSLDALVNMLTDAGMQVDVKIRQPSRRVA